MSWTVYKVILGEKPPPYLTFEKCSTLDHNYRWILEQNMHVCKVCVAERSRSRHHMMKHNGRMNLPMSTGCITIDRTLNIGSEEISTTQI